MFSELTGETPPDNFSTWSNKRRIFARNIKSKPIAGALMTIEEEETKKYLMYVF